MTDRLPDEDDFNVAKKLGSDIDADLAKQTDTTCTKKYANDKFFKGQERYLCPNNCSLLLTPKVNPDLWGDLSDARSAQQLELENIRRVFVNSFKPLFMLGNKVVHAGSNKAESIPMFELSRLHIPFPNVTNIVSL